MVYGYNKCLYGLKNTKTFEKPHFVLLTISDGKIIKFCSLLLFRNLTYMRCDQTNIQLFAFSLNVQRRSNFT